jgi:hypothetical protein
VCVYLCVFFASGGVVDDQLHDGKEYFFLIIFMRTKKLLSRPLCCVFRDHITYIVLQATPESKKGLSSPAPGNLLDNCYSETCILSTFLYSLYLSMCGTPFF